MPFSRHAGVAVSAFDLGVNTTDQRQNVSICTLPTFRLTV